MKLLLDTHLLLWLSYAPHRLSAAAAGLLQSPEHQHHFSPASLWEIAIKTNRPGGTFSVDAEQLHSSLLSQGIREVAIEARHAMAAGRLPLLHRDPFDRMLLAQAAAEDLLLLTADQTLARYPGPVRLV